MKKNCEYCNDIFEAKRKDVVYCSASCRQMAYMERKLQNFSEPSSIQDLTFHNSTENFKTSIDVLKEESENKSVETIQNPLSESNKLSIDVLRKESEPSIDVLKTTKQNEGYQEASSNLINDIADLMNNRDYIHPLNTIYYSNKDLPSYWVGMRLKCLAECLLLFSEMKTTDVDDLKEICNSFTMIINSEYYKRLPVKFPYKQKLVLWRDKLKQVCMDSDETESVAFRLSRENKMDLIITRFELSHFIPKQKFSELDFNE